MVVRNVLILNVSKSTFTIFGSARYINIISDTPLLINNLEIRVSKALKYQGVTVDHALPWSDYVQVTFC